MTITGLIISEKAAKVQQQTVKCFQKTQRSIDCLDRFQENVVV